MSLRREGVIAFKCWLFSLFSLSSYNTGSQVWQQSVASTLDTYLVIEDLMPGCQYQFRVSASNPWGISLPSEASEFVKLPEYGEPVFAKEELTFRMENFTNVNTSEF